MVIVKKIVFKQNCENSKEFNVVDVKSKFVKIEKVGILQLFGLKLQLVRMLLLPQQIVKIIYDYFFNI